MDASMVQVGSTLMDGQRGFRATERGDFGWWGLYISFTDRNLTGDRCFIGDMELADWRDVPFEWVPAGNGQEHRYRWSDDFRRLVRETRPIRLPVDCRSEHGVGHPDCPKCWRWSERNPNRETRPMMTAEQVEHSLGR